MADTIQFRDPYNSAKEPVTPKDKSTKIAGMVTPTGPEMPPVYPSTTHSLHTWAGSWRDSDGTKEGLRDNSFWKRLGIAAFQMTFINFFTGLIALIAWVVTKENGTFNDIQYSLIIGFSVALNLILSQAIVHYPGAMLHAVEIWLEHYSKYIHAPFYRIIFWLAMVGARLVGYGAAAGFAWGLQVNNAVTRAGLPIITPAGATLGLGWTFSLCMFAAAFVYWAFLHMYYNPEAASDVNQSNAPYVVGITAFIATYITLPYIEGGFEFERYLVCSVWSGFWPSNGWVFAAGPAAAALVVTFLYYCLYRTTMLSGASGVKSE